MNLNGDHVSKKREEYLATAKSIKEILVDDTGDENYGDVPVGVAPEEMDYTDDESMPVENAMSMMGMRTTDKRNAQLAQMPQAEKDYYFVQGDVNILADEYEQNVGTEDYDDVDDYEDEDYDDDNEVEMDIDLTDALDFDAVDTLNDIDDEDSGDFVVVDDDGDIDDEEGYSEENEDYDDEEDDDIDEIIAMLQSMGITDFGDDFDDGYEEDDADNVVMVASYNPRRKGITGTVPATPASRPTDPDSTAVASNKVYGLLFR